MALGRTKIDLLENAGYRYNYDRMMYINRKTKKAFSVEFVDDEPLSRIRSKIQEPTKEAEWKFYTNLPVSEGTERELRRVLQ